MTIYFAFSDECGDYKEKRNGDFCTSHPFYVRATVMFAADSYIPLKKDATE